MSEDNALVLGAGLLFVVLAVIMVATPRSTGTRSGRASARRRPRRVEQPIESGCRRSPRNLSGAGLAAAPDEVTNALRIAVFRDWPYLYDGDVGYEREYLAACAESPSSVVVLARDGEAVVAPAPASRWRGQCRVPGAFRRTRDGGGQVFYCGESVLLPLPRARPRPCVLRRARGAHARALGGFARTAFAAVDRDDGDPRKPRRASRQRGVLGQARLRAPAGMTMKLHWNEVGIGEVEHPPTFWLRPLEASA